MFSLSYSLRILGLRQSRGGSSLRELAFDVNSNVSIVESSIALARAHNVLEHKILKNEEDLRSFLFD